MRRAVVATIVLGMLPFVPGPASATCAERLLVVSAFPGEIHALLADAQVDQTVVTDGRTFYLGTLRGNDVVMALTGIGLQNARASAELAFDTFDCETGSTISGVVFSGVAGSRYAIGDVTVPSAWTLEDDTFDVDPGMLAVAAAVSDAGVELASQTPLGDAACAGLDPSLVSTIALEHEPQIYVGGVGKSTDPFGGRTFPCFPGGGDVFGCHPCNRPAVPDAPRFVEGILPFIDPAFFFGYFEEPPPAGTEYVAEDMESAAVAAVADERGAPFIAFRAASDGEGDPLMLPGFPFQFFVYRQIAADNAAAVTLAFLEAWAAA